MSKPRTLDDIDEDDDYVPSVVQPVGSIANSANSASPTAADDFFGTFGAAPAKPQPSAQPAPPKATQQNKTADLFDDFFGDSTIPAAAPSTSNSNPSKTASNGNFLDFESRPTVTRHVTSDPQQYLELATGGGTRLKPKSTLGGNVPVSSSSGGGRQVGSGGDNGSAHILGNPFLLSRMTHYEVLGVPELVAEGEDIHKAYKKKCLTLHPDRVVGRTQSEAEKTYFKAVVKAYEILSDASLRAEYDAELREYRSGGGIGAPPSQQQALAGDGSPNGNDGGQTQQNQGGWDFLDDNAGNGGLGDFTAPTQQKQQSPGDDFFGTAKPSTQQKTGAAAVLPQPGVGGWGNFSSSSASISSTGTGGHTKPPAHQPQQPVAGPKSLFGGQNQNPTIDDLFS